MRINLILEDLTPEFVKYSFIINNYIFHMTVTNELTKTVEFISKESDLEKLNVDELKVNNSSIDNSNSTTMHVSIQNDLSSNNIPQLDEKIAEQIYQKILWYKKLDNFFVKGFVNIT